MIKSGYKPRKFLWWNVKDRRDYSHKSFGAVQVSWPPEYNTDAGLTMPNQDLQNNQFTPPHVEVVIRASILNLLTI